MMNCYSKMEESQKNYTPTEKSIAQYILEHSRDVLNYSAQVLGEKTKTSAAAVIRFSKKTGYEGFSDFKISLASSKQITNTNQIDTIMTQDDNIEDIVKKGYLKNIETIEKTYQILDRKVLETAVEKMNQAKTIYLFGIGGSSICANDFTQKLLRIGKKVIYNSDAHIQGTFVESITKDDVALFISYSGMTEFMVKVCQRVKKEEIPIISITQSTMNDISRLSDYPLYVPVTEKPLRMGAITSRTSSLFVTDSLYYGIFQTHMEENKEKLRETRKIISND